MNKVYIASRDGTMKEIPCVDNGSYIAVAKKDLPAQAYAAFLDGLKSCMIEDTGRFLDILPTSELSMQWCFSKD